MATATIDSRINSLATTIAKEIKTLKTNAGGGLDSSRWTTLFSGDTSATITLKKPWTDFSVIRTLAAFSRWGGEARKHTFVPVAQVKSLIGKKEIILAASFNGIAVLLVSSTSTKLKFFIDSCRILQIDGFK